MKKNLIAAALFCAVFIGLVWFSMYKYPARLNDVEVSSPSQSPTITAAVRMASSRTPPSGFKEYHQVTYHFSLFYPQELSVKEYKEPGTAMTITFYDAENEKGFQIFIVPYGEKQIAEQRFKLDIPSGVMHEPIEVTIDGVRAVAFFSTDAILGDTREVWFINHGFLFEVTTYKELDEWLAHLMTTWKFIEEIY